MRLIFAFLIALSLTGNALAASQWYQIELFVFAQENPKTTERWDTSVTPSFAQDAVTLDSQHPTLPSNASDANMTALDSGAWTLEEVTLDHPAARMANRMRNNRQYRIMYEARWIQPVFSTVNALPVSIAGGESLPAPVIEKPRQNSFGDKPGDAQQVEHLPEDDVANAMQFMPELQGTVLFSLQQYVHLSTNLWLASEAEGQRFFAHMNESRRLKNGELHYLDHPLFGVVVRVTRLKRE